MKDLPGLDDATERAERGESPQVELGTWEPLRRSGLAAWSCLLRNTTMPRRSSPWCCLTRLARCPHWRSSARCSSTCFAHTSRNDAPAGDIRYVYPLAEGVKASHHSACYLYVLLSSDWGCVGCLLEGWGGGIMSEGEGVGAEPESLWPRVKLSARSKHPSCCSAEVAMTRSHRLWISGI